MTLCFIEEIAFVITGNCDWIAIFAQFERRHDLRNQAGIFGAADPHRALIIAGVRLIKMIDVKQSSPTANQRRERGAGPQIRPIPRIQIKIAIPPANRQPIPRKLFIAKVGRPKCQAKVDPGGSNRNHDPGVMAVGFNIDSDAVRRFSPIRVGGQMAADQCRSEIKCDDPEGEQSCAF